MESDLKSTRLNASGAIFAGPARVKCIYWVAGATAGTITIRDGGAGGAVVAVIDTPASATATDNIILPGAGIRCQTDAYCTISNTSFVTIFYA